MNNPTPTTHDIEKKMREEIKYILFDFHKKMFSGSDIYRDECIEKTTDELLAHTKEEVIREVLEIVGEDVSNMKVLGDIINQERSRIRQAITNLREMK